jgi:hypothetical protein
MNGKRTIYQLPMSKTTKRGWESTAQMTRESYISTWTETKLQMRNGKK